jgi:hypothetical protein
MQIPHVQDMIVEFFNRLIGYGVAGFRLDAGKHMWPEDLQTIFNRLNDLPSAVFGAGKRPFMYLEVIHRISPLQMSISSLLLLIMQSLIAFYGYEKSIECPNSRTAIAARCSLRTTYTACTMIRTIENNHWH